jgi:NAD(P)-dependent dehydrogenase (short-subunit alcohol dehydrogenase family)
MSVAVVTGAGQGQGAAEARRLAARGVTVIAVDLGAEPAEDLAAAEYRQLDVTDEGGWAVLAQDLAGRFGRVDGLVANAGITWRARLLDVTPADLRHVHEVNVTGALLAIQSVTPAAPAFRAANLAETPLGRTGTVEDVAPLVAFLLSDRRHRRGVRRLHPPDRFHRRPGPPSCPAPARPH